MLQISSSSAGWAEAGSRGATNAAGAPAVAVGADDLAQRGPEDRGVGVGPPGPVDHDLETLHLARQALAARLGAFDAERELEVLFIADEDVRNARDLAEQG